MTARWKALEKKEDSLVKKEQELSQVRAELDELTQKKTSELERISGPVD